MVWKGVKDSMEIGKKLKEARLQSGLTQEKAAEKIGVSRQTISNWENEKSYPDIVSVIRLSDIYSISLDSLLKGDDKMMEHLEESTDIVRSNRKLAAAAGANVVLVAVMVILSMFLPENEYFLAAVFCLMIIAASVLFYQIIKRF